MLLTMHVKDPVAVENRQNFGDVSLAILAHLICISHYITVSKHQNITYMLVVMGSQFALAAVTGFTGTILPRLNILWT